MTRAPDWVVVAFYVVSLSALAYVIPRAFAQTHTADLLERAKAKRDRLQAYTERGAPR